MCLPALAAIPATTMLAAQTAVGVAGALAAHAGQASAARAQTKAATASYNSSMAQLAEQRRQQGVQTQTEMSERAKQAMIERGRLNAASAEGGVIGTSINRIKSANEYAYGSDLAMMRENYTNTSRQSVLEGQAMGATYQSRLSQIERPSILNTGLQIAGVGLDAASQYKKLK